jgi:hypothetical protein
MYTELTHIRIPYGEITYLYEKAHVTVVKVILRLEITNLSYMKMLWFDPIICYINRGNKEVDIGYNMNYMKVLEWLRDDSSP